MSYKIINDNKIGLCTLNKGNKRLHVSYFNIAGLVAHWYDRGVLTKGFDFYLNGAYCISGKIDFYTNVKVLEKI